VSREGLRVREVSDEEGNRLLRIVRRSSGSVVTWRRAQMVLLSVQGMDVAGIAKVSSPAPTGTGGHKTTSTRTALSPCTPSTPVAGRRRSASPSVKR